MINPAVIIIPNPGSGMDVVVQLEHDVPSHARTIIHPFGSG